MTTIPKSVGVVAACVVIVATLTSTPAEARPARAERAHVHQVQLHDVKLLHHPRGHRSRFLCIVGEPCPPPCEIVQPCHGGTTGGQR